MLNLVFSVFMINQYENNLHIVALIYAFLFSVLLLLVQLYFGCYLKNRTLLFSSIYHA